MYVCVHTFWVVLVNIKYELITALAFSKAAIDFVLVNSSVCFFE